jgi:TolA-binding protein
VKRASSIESHVETYGAMRRAFRDLTGVEADGAATRARVLAGAERDVARRERRHRIAIPLAAAVLASASVSAALAVVHRLRPPAPVMIESSASADASVARYHPTDGRAVRVIPFETTATFDLTAGGERRPRAAAAVSDAETRAYARAHQAHFADDASARALDAWDAYLAGFPHGAFAPEATYNRAICLVRLERRAEAVRALRRIAAAPPGSYRREEALRLLDWLDTGDPD